MTRPQSFGLGPLGFSSFDIGMEWIVGTEQELCSSVTLLASVMGVRNRGEYEGTDIGTGCGKHKNGGRGKIWEEETWGETELPLLLSHC